MRNIAIAIVGPTSSGKSELAVRLAKKFKCEIISADSRQVYKGLDIGSGKISKKEMSGIPHHLLDVASPKQKFTVTRFEKLAKKVMAQIWQRGNLPIIAGGTGFYVDVLTGEITTAAVKPDQVLRQKLGKLPAEKLFARLQKLDPDRAKTIDPKNPHRLIRAIEIASNSRGEAERNLSPLARSHLDIGWLKIGIQTDPDDLKQQINRRLDQRLRRGLISEVKKLKQSGLSWKRLEELGLEYRLISRHLRGQLSIDSLIAKLEIENWKLAKRQLTWFKRDSSIVWIKNYREAEKSVLAFLRK